MKESRYWHIAAMALACVPFGHFGCSDDGVGKRYSVTGTVTYKNEPVEKGAITFTPAKADVGRVATGTIEKGSYTLSTLGDRDGAIPGDYLVSITSRVPDMSKAETNAEKSGGSVRQDDVAKAYKQAKGSTPVKYETPETSGLTAKVEARSNKIDFPITD